MVVNRVLTSQDDEAWCFAMQDMDGTIRHGCVAYHGGELTAEEARRFGHILIEAAAKLDELTR